LVSKTEITGASIPLGEGMGFNLKRIVNDVGTWVENTQAEVGNSVFAHYVNLEVSCSSSTFNILLKRHVNRSSVWEWSYSGYFGLLGLVGGWYIHNFITGAVHLGHLSAGAVMRMDGVYTAGNTWAGRTGSGQMLNSRGTIPSGSLSWKVVSVSGVAF